VFDQSTQVDNSSSSRSGDQFTGDDTTTITSADVVVDQSTTTNVSESVVDSSTTTNQGSSVDASNADTGLSTLSSASSSTSAGTEYGADGTRTFAGSDTGSSGSTVTEAANAFDGTSTTTEYDSSASTTTTTDTYSGGAGGNDTQTVTASSNTTLQDTANADTGDYNSTSFGTTSSNTTEAGSDATGYSLSGGATSTFTNTETGNSDTGDYSLTTSSTDGSTYTRTGSDSSGNTYSIVQSDGSSGSVSTTGNHLSGDYTAATGGSDTVTTSQINSGPTADNTLIQIEDVFPSLVNTGNDFTGDFTTTGTETDDSALAESGTNGGGYYQVETSLADNVTVDVGGNNIDGTQTTTRTGEALYGFQENTSDSSTGNDSTLNETGDKPYTLVSTQDANTGDNSSTETGTDTYTINQNGDQDGSVYTMTVTGSEGYGIDISSNSQNGTFSQGYTGGGSYSRDNQGTDSLGSPFSTSDTGSTGYSDTQAGDTRDASVALSQSGTDRYALLTTFNNVSSGGQGIGGVADYSPVGLPIVVTRASVPAGIFSNIGDDRFDYCFAAGTMVLMADGTRKAIEKIEAGEMVLSVPDTDPEAQPRACRVMEVYHNAPARLLAVSVSGPSEAGTAGVIRCTAEHPFHVRGHGWTRAVDLRPGQKLRTSDGEWAAVVSLADTGKRQAVFNLRVDGCRTYFVSHSPAEAAVLVHNQSWYQGWGSMVWTALGGNGGSAAMQVWKGAGQGADAGSQEAGGVLARPLVWTGIIPADVAAKEDALTEKKWEKISLENSDVRTATRVSAGIGGVATVAAVAVVAAPYVATAATTGAGAVTSAATTATGAVLTASGATTAAVITTGTAVGTAVAGAIGPTLTTVAATVIGIGLVEEEDGNLGKDVAVLKEEGTEIVDDLAVDLGNVGCFRAGTPVLCSRGLRPIEQIRVGDRVLTGDGNESSTPIEPASHRLLRLSFVKDGQEIRMSFIRRASLVKGLGAGDFMQLEVLELQVQGRARVIAVEPCPEIESGAGHVVTGEFCSQTADVRLLGVDGLRAPIEVTGNHPVFSEDRRRFVPVSELGPGERLRTQDGVAVVESVTHKTGDWEVFNLEIDGVHEYYVTERFVLVHNALTNKMVGEGSAAENTTLARQVADEAEQYPMKWKRTVSIVDTVEGPKVVGGGATDLDAAQVAKAKELNLTVAPPAPGVHAEPTVIQGARSLGLTPTKGVTTNIICPQCKETDIPALGGKVTGKRTFEMNQ
jgi:hypothetical protein